MSTPNFSDEFRRSIDKIEADAKACGLNFTSICKEAGISRATPDRWKRKTPTTVALIAKMQGIVQSKREELAMASPHKA